MQCELKCIHQFIQSHYYILPPLFLDGYPVSKEAIVFVHIIVKEKLYRGKFRTPYHPKLTHVSDPKVVQRGELTIRVGSFASYWLPVLKKASCLIYTVSLE